MKDTFFKHISALISDEPSVEFEWRKDNSEIIFKKKSKTGFDVIVRYEKQYLIIFTDRGFHEHFEAFERFDEILSDVMGVVRDLLSNNMRIKEILSNKKPVRWLLQHNIGNGWKTEATNGLICYNYFGKKSEKIYSNDAWPPRPIR